MNAFTNALLSDKRNPMIPEELDWFAPMLGAWRFDGEYRDPQGEWSKSKGEWIFSRVLDGTAVQDVFIWPPRGERDGTVGEYGTTLRVFHPAKQTWDVTFFNAGYSIQLDVVREGERIVLTDKAQGKMHWAFSDIQQDSFVWRSTTDEDDGSVTLNAELHVRRVG